MNERLKEIRAKSGLSMKKFGEIIGVSDSTIALIEKGTRGITDRVVRDVCREFNINEKWLRTGNGEMTTPPTRQDEIADLATKLYGADPDSFEYKVAMYLKDLPIEDWKRFRKFIKDLSEFAE